MVKNLVLGTILAEIWAPQFFLWVLPMLVFRYCSKVSSYAISRKAIEPNLRKWQQNLVLGLILAPLAQIWA